MNFEIFLDDLKPLVQRRVLRAMNVKDAKDFKWSLCPLCVFEISGGDLNGFV